MKKIILIILVFLFFGIQNSFGCYTETDKKIAEAENLIKIRELSSIDLKLLNTNNTEIEIYNLYIEKTNIEISKTKNDIKIYRVSNGDTKWCGFILSGSDENNFNAILSILNKKLKIYTDKLNNIKKIEEENKQKELEKEKIEKEKLNKELIIKESLENTKKANDLFLKGNFEDAIIYYNSSCMNVINFECYYGIAISSFNISKKENIEYNKKIILNKNTIKAKDNIDLRIKITDSIEEKEKANKLLNEILLLENKIPESKIVENIKQNEIIKVETIKQVEEIKQDNTKTKLQIKQDELKVKINTIYKKSPKSIQKLLQQITKLKKKTKAGTDTYVLLETIETEINLLQKQK